MSAPLTVLPQETSPVIVLVASPVVPGVWLMRMPAVLLTPAAPLRLVRTVPLPFGGVVA